MSASKLWNELIRPLAVSLLSIIVDTACAEEILSLKFQNFECHKKFLSRGIGLAILAGSAFIKIPQIIKILLSGSVGGLSAQTYLIELQVLGLYAAFNYRRGSPLILYGETILVMVQNFIIILLILRVHKNPFYIKLCLMLNGILLPIIFSPQLISLNTISKLQPLAAASAIASKLPQILTNHRRKSTGQLSTITVTAQTGGAVARAITIYIETNDPGLIFCNISSFILSFTILVQIFLYGSKEPPTSEVRSQSHPKSKQKEHKAPRNHENSQILGAVPVTVGARKRTRL